MNVVKKFNNTKFKDLQIGDMFSYSYRDEQDIGDYDMTNDIYLVIADSDENRSKRILNLNTNELYKYNLPDDFEVTKYWGTLNLYLEQVDNIIGEE